MFSITCKFSLFWLVPSQAFLNKQAQLLSPLFFCGFFFGLKYPPPPYKVITFECIDGDPSFLNWQMKSDSTCNTMYNYKLIYNSFGLKHDSVSVRSYSEVGFYFVREAGVILD